ncbi:uncharacterized protein LOC126579120 [Anopheles aquasalis]|uniref:uncharacterized protein LOC126579120 n=1 Tax=Anopheles aquasalis TaxID=42839 RepID=UPI00215A43BF|nr:uncharacterized protein LOC126579120 [Anopheles aquasalis]
MVPRIVQRWAVCVVVVMVLVLGVSEAKKCGVICRVRDPLRIGNSHALKECLYEVYPVESTQNADSTVFQSENRNRLFSLYGGPSSCEYFGNMIATAKGRDTLVETIAKQLQKSGFKGLDLQCDPMQAHVSQHTYASFIEQLRNFLGNTYVIMVTLHSCQPDLKLIGQLNRCADYVVINQHVQSSTLSNALSLGLQRQRILLTTPFPSQLNCPLTGADHALSETLNHIQQQSLFGAVVQVDQDDVNNVCGEGPYPLLRKVLDHLCRDAECSFRGFVRDTRDCGQYYTCDNGYTTTHHCPPGHSFDLCQSSCQPFLTVNCNQTTCVVSGALPPGLAPVPYPIPFPINPTNPCLCIGGNNTNGGGGNNGGGGGGGNNNNNLGNCSVCCCDLLGNLTKLFNSTQMAQFSNFIDLIVKIGVDDLVKTISDFITPLKPLLKQLVDAINGLLISILGGKGSIDITKGTMDGLNKDGNILSNLLHTLINLLNSLLGGGGGGGNLLNLTGAGALNLLSPPGATGAELSRINEMKRSSPKADVLLTIALPLNVSATATHGPLSERIGIVLRDNGLDGVDLDYDVAPLDDYGHIRYGQFLRALRSLLGSKYLVSTTIGCQSLGGSKLLLQSFNDQLDMVSVIGVDTAPSSLGESGEFTVRDYTIEPIRQLVRQGLNVQKIVLSVLTVGIVFNPSNYRNSRSLQPRNRVGVLSYGQVCELLGDRRAKCGSAGTDSLCSLFSGKGAIVYDDEQTVERRTNQAKQLGARGVLMLLNYDDADNVCDRGSYPLFRALWRTAQSTLQEREDAGGSVCGPDGRYADTQDPSVYYTYQDGRFHQHRCKDGEQFNNVLAMCIEQMKPKLNPVDDEESATDESPRDSSEPTTPYRQNSMVESVQTATFPPSAPETDAVEPLSQTTLERMVSYLNGIIERALALVQRLEHLEALSGARTQSVIQSDADDGGMPGENVQELLSFM